MKPLQTCLLAASAILALNGNASIYRIVSPSGTVTAEIINEGDLSWRVSHDGKEGPFEIPHINDPHRRHSLGTRSTRVRIL